MDVSTIRWYRTGTPVRSKCQQSLEVYHVQVIQPPLSNLLVMADAAHPRRRYGRGDAVPIGGSVPTEVLEDPLLNGAIDALLPRNYNFEIHKTVFQIRKYGATCVALQMPEGLTMWATGIVDIIERYMIC